MLVDWVVGGVGLVCIELTQLVVMVEITDDISDDTWCEEGSEAFVKVECFFVGLHME